VICLSGDGSACYTLQALWSAAHHGIAVVFLIINNGSYRILKLNMDRYRREAHIDTARLYPHMDLTQPAVDFVRIAGGFGVGGKRVNYPDELGAAVRAAFDAGALKPRRLLLRKLDFDLDARIPGHQVVYVLVTQTHGDNVHLRVNSLPGAETAQLRAHINFALPCDMRHVGPTAQAVLAVASDAHRGFFVSRLRASLGSNDAGKARQQKAERAGNANASLLQLIHSRLRKGRERGFRSRSQWPIMGAAPMRRPRT
jgi:hypothetical protein